MQLRIWKNRNAKDQDYEEDTQDTSNKVERFTCDVEGCKRSFRFKNDFLVHFRCHFTDELTCNQCNVTFTLKNGLGIHLLLHKNKWQFQCQHEGCEKLLIPKLAWSFHKVLIWKTNDSNAIIVLIKQIAVKVLIITSKLKIQDKI